MTLTASERSRRARIAAYSQHAAGRTNTAVARAALFQSFEDQVDPDRVLPEAERKRRAEFAKKAHYERVTFKRQKTLAARKNRTAAAREAAAAGRPSVTSTAALEEVSRGTGEPR